MLKTCWIPGRKFVLDGDVLSGLHNDDITRSSPTQVLLYMEGME